MLTAEQRPLWYSNPSSSYIILSFEIAITICCGHINVLTAVAAEHITYLYLYSICNIELLAHGAVTAD